MKRVAAIFFILFANIIMLVHTILPHHQHNGEIVLLNASHKSCVEEHFHNKCNHNSGHNLQLCVLTQNFIIPSNPIKKECNLFEDKSNYPDTNVFQAFLGERIFISLNQKEFFGNLPPLITSADSLFLNRIFGLRAPPMV